MSFFFRILHCIHKQIHFLQDICRNSWQLFSYNPNLLCCGFAGIVPTLPKSTKKSAQLQQLWQDIQSLSIEHLTMEQQSLLQRIQEETLFQEDNLFCNLAQNVQNQNCLWQIGDFIANFIQQQETNWELDENKNAILIQLRDIVWRIQEEHQKNLQAISVLAGKELSLLNAKQIQTYRRINTIFNMINRLEIRGRDSAGIVISMTITRWQELQQELARQNLAQEYQQRLHLEDLVSSCIKELQVDQGYRINFIYKVCNAVGRLGDNVRELRLLVQKDILFHLFLNYAEHPLGYLSHTRWASNGIINIFNCHPLDNEIIFPNGKHNILSFEKHPHYHTNGYLFVALNGDIDNYSIIKHDLETKHQLCISPKITTDAKIIAIVIQQYLQQGLNLSEAFQKAVCSFEGSHAIAMQSDLEPGKIFLALHGSGQAIYIGLCPDRYLVASEVYGLVEDTNQYLAMDGETPRILGCPETQGQIFILDQRGCGLEGIQAIYYDGTPISLQPQNIRYAEITTRDIDRQHFSHFFDKEIHQAHISVLNTIKGKFTLHQGQAELNLPTLVTPNICQALQTGQIKRIFTIGQGTASIAAEVIAYQMRKTFENIQVQALKSSELSGFYLRQDMHDTLVIAITQSGTTTDTNRAVDMSKKRGAYTMAIVNRRNSHITSMVDSVLYTSNGRDIEMSVASTKAFYSQVTAGELLTIALAVITHQITPEQATARIMVLRSLPELLKQVLATEDKIADIASRLAVKRQHWAIVGSGPNFIAAQEIRIKLSELCYKSIAYDFIEDKKHIDLSAEPMILVCAAGSPNSVLGDIIKDVAIFKAHNSTPIVIVSEGEHRFDPYASAVITVNKADELSSLVLNTIAGHIFGYHVAKSIQNQSRFFAGLRDSLVSALNNTHPDLVLVNPSVQNILAQFKKEFHIRCREGFFSALSPHICSEVAILLSHAMGKFSIQNFREEFGVQGSSGTLLEILLDRLHRATEELSRPIDAIKHQAKTVTVGTSRTEAVEELTGVIFDVLRNAHIVISELRTNIVARLQQLQPAICAVNGYSYYEISGLDATGQPLNTSTIQLLRREGLATHLPSRCATGPTILLGTKKAIIQKGEIFLGLGVGDRRPILIIPLFASNNIISHEMLLHISYAQHLTASQAKDVVGKLYLDIQNAVTELCNRWQDDWLTLISPEFLCTRSVEEIAEEILHKIE